MKRLKENTVAKLVNTVAFFKKYTSLLSFFLGALIGLVRYFVCKSFQCAFGYFMGVSLITLCVLTFVMMVLQIIAKNQITKFYLDSIGVNLTDKDKKNLNVTVEQTSGQIENNNKEDIEQ